VLVKPFWREAERICREDCVTRFFVEIFGLEVRVADEQRVPAKGGDGYACCGGRK
jgi:hypothetical protein